MDLGNFFPAKSFGSLVPDGLKWLWHLLFDRLNHGQFVLTIFERFDRTAAVLIAGGLGGEDCMGVDVDDVQITSVRTRHIGDRAKSH